jgi:hypothetical protein
MVKNERHHNQIFPKISKIYVETLYFDILYKVRITRHFYRKGYFFSVLHVVSFSTI